MNFSILATPPDAAYSGEAKTNAVRASEDIVINFLFITYLLTNNEFVNRWQVLATKKPLSEGQLFSNLRGL